MVWKTDRDALPPQDGVALFLNMFRGYVTLTAHGLVTSTPYGSVVAIVVDAGGEEVVLSGCVGRYRWKGRSATRN